MAKETPVRTPPMEKSDEADEKTLNFAREQGETYQQALKYMAEKEAHGASKRAGDYLVSYAVEKAEGMYELKGEKLEWHEPEDANVHIEIAVQDGADHRFIPGLKVQVTVSDSDGKKIGTHQQDFLWHPWLYHYGRNWQLPGDGKYDIHVRIDPPTFMRHDKKNGKRYAEPVELTFENVEIKTGKK